MKLNQVTIIVAVLMAAVFAMPSHADRISRGGKFVGLSDDLVPGEFGLKGLEQACVNTFNRPTIQISIAGLGLTPGLRAEDCGLL